MMQSLVGIVRHRPEMEQALARLAELRARAARARVPGNREYNPGWHTALDLPHLLTVSEAIARAALERTESRGAHFRDDHPGKEAAWEGVQLAIRKGADGAMTVAREPVPPMTAEQKRIVEEMG
jgi:succinate dehydrogenase / fumarate reductase flavoprotein subunit